MLKEFLSKLGASTRITIGVSVSPNVGVEMIEIDNSTGTVNKYSCRPLDYNNSTREIADYEQFRVALEELFDDLNVPSRSNVVISLPSVYFGLISLPNLLTEDAITNAIVSEVEQSYVFKRQEPLVSWSDVTPKGNSDETKFIAYSAIQKSAVEQITEICEEIGCNITCIENSFNSLFRALSYLSVTNNQMKDGVAWNLMVIMQNNYSILSMNGKRPVEYYEEPLALKSFIDDEIYNAIKTSAQMTLAGFPANYLYIVSETDLVSAEVLSLKMPFEGDVGFLECNKFSQSEIMSTSLNVLPNKAPLITAEAVGAGVYQFHDFAMKMNFVQKTTKDNDDDFDEMEEDTPRFFVGNLEVELTSDFVRKLALIISSAIIAPSLIILLLLNQFVLPKEEKRLSIYEQNIKTLNSNISKLQATNQNSSFDIYSAIDNIVLTNKNKRIAYSAMELSVPDKLWITYYETNNDGKVLIKGSSGSTEKIYIFYKNLRQLINNSSLMLRKLELASGSLDDVIMETSVIGKSYVFEITDMTDAEISALMTGTMPAATAENGQPNNDPNQQNQPATEVGKSITVSPDSKSLFELGGGVQTKTDNKSQQTTQNQPQPTEASAQNNNGLPPNLRKIEKF